MYYIYVMTLKNDLFTFYYLRNKGVKQWKI